MSFIFSMGMGFSLAKAEEGPTTSTTATAAAADGATNGATDAAPTCMKGDGSCEHKACAQMKTGEECPHAKDGTCPHMKDGKACPMMEKAGKKHGKMRGKMSKKMAEEK